MALCDEIETGRLNANPASTTSTVVGGVAHMMKIISEKLATRARHVERRDAFKNLLKLDARTLKDIGVTRQDVIWASKLPLSQDAASELKALRENDHLKGVSK